MSNKYLILLVIIVTIGLVTFPMWLDKVDDKVGYLYTEIEQEKDYYYDPDGRYIRISTNVWVKNSVSHFSEDLSYRETEYLDESTNIDSVMLVEYDKAKEYQLKLNEKHNFKTKE